MRICSTNEATDEENKKKMEGLNQKIATVKALNNNKTLFLSSDDVANGLTNILPLCKGAKVMFKKNLNVSRGLVNGSIGMIWGLTNDYVPMTPVCNTWYRSGVLCSRIQLPLVVCWACTIHKSQGLTLSFMMLDAGKSEFALGLLYVALSRVPDIESLCLVVSLTLDRLNSVRKSKQFVSNVQYIIG
ncbi:ATP-dependent DNA helicase [Frankliniella fusca]|uniref:ATP-dependent DNA helicase n=1 Tax=Frankliniella fusca TaxID=407009 RepID=A0AAE1GZB7_9NEOP|nr:ATP-dependent DNA helicase [Frankliniella fusca]